MIEAWDLVFEGRVQGVGFRPFVWTQAQSHPVCGWVSNTPQGVLVHIESEAQACQALFDGITQQAPSPILITTAKKVPGAIHNCTSFVIQPSTAAGEHLGAIIPDLCLCELCKQELFDPSNRRFLHPFISCTHCGPRFSIVQGLPYDRPLTSMGKFPMCPTCQGEYNNPRDRRFHAQPICCHECGPHIWCETLGKNPAQPWMQSKEPWLDIWVSHTLAGGISLVKGIGGFHLLCDANNHQALQTLRNRKQRDGKPFALMVPSIEYAKTLCKISPEEEALLVSVERPIVILDIISPLSTMPLLAPGLTQLGIMLPHSGAQELFFSRFCQAVVLTSANHSNEPMLTSNEEARSLGSKWCDLLVLHDREIVNRADDGVVAVVAASSHQVVLRSGRGASPREFPWAQCRTGLAFGADLKNAVALAHHGRVTLSQHIGDMENPLTEDIALQICERLCTSYRVTPEFIAYDAHPDYHSSQLAYQFAAKANIPLFAVQHHHAHIAATWLEHQWDGPALGFAMDGTGYGDPTCIWGSEVLLYEGGTSTPLTHMEGLRLPGGDRAVREPARILLAALHDYAPALRERWFANHEHHARLYESGLQSMLASDLNCPSSRGMGRLFDLVGAMLEWKKPSWDGETGTLLENLDVDTSATAWPIETQNGQILLAPIITAALQDVLQGQAPSQVSSRLHATVCSAMIELGAQAQSLLGTHSGSSLPWAFAGGAFQNRKIVARLQKHPQILARNCYFSSIPNDNGIALGQIVVATHLSR